MHSTTQSLMLLLFHAEPEVPRRQAEGLPAQIGVSGSLSVT